MSNKSKINKDEFLQIVSDESGVDIKTVSKIYDGFVNTIKKSVCSGKNVSLTRFGTFSIKEHKGHPVQFQSENSSSGSIKNYIVFKFDVSDVFIKQIRMDYKSTDAAEMTI